MTSVGVLAAGTKVLYRDASVGRNVDATVVKVHYDDVPPYYTIAIDGRDGERETLRSRLTPIQAGAAAAADDSGLPPEVGAIDAAVDITGLLELASLASAAESAARLFKDIDADGDGAVTKRELRQYFESHGRDPAVAQQLFEGMDSDRDGLLDYDEFKRLYRAATSASQGSLNAEVKEQLDALFADAGGPDALFDEIDADHDGALTRREIAAYLVKRGGDGSSAVRLLTAIDGDKDGLIDKHELRAAHTRLTALPPAAGTAAPALPQFGGSDGTQNANAAFGGAYSTHTRSNAG